MVSLPFLNKQKKTKSKQPDPTQQVISTLQDMVAPSALEINPNFIKLGTRYCSTMFILSYPNFLSANWFSALVNLDETFNLSIFFHPVDPTKTLQQLRKKSAEIQAQISLAAERGLVRDPLLEASLANIEELRDLIQQGAEKLFNTGVYLTFFASNLESFKQIEARIKNILEQQMIYAKPAIFRQYEGFESTLPLGIDRLFLVAPLNSQPAATLFGFSSLDLADNQGILYGLNLHNNSLVLFDRFSMPNANMIILGQSGSGKSYSVKLELIRSLLIGTDVIIIDPENEYAYLSEVVGGSFFKLAVGSPDRINPFDLPTLGEDETKDEVFRSHVLQLIGLVKLLVGEVTPQEEILLDNAITQTYASRDIFPETFEPDQTPPLLEDLESTLNNIEGGETLAAKLYKYTRGTFAQFLNQPSNVNLNNRLIIFGLRDLEDELRPIAMYVALSFIQTQIKKTLKKRILAIDEGWWLLKNEASASFLFGIVKKARKYYLGVSFISQDVEDLLTSPYGRPIMTNSSLAFLLKQSPANTESLAKALELSEGEKTFLLQASTGTGLFLAIDKHAAIQVLASYAEDQIITTNPAQVLEIQKIKKEMAEEP
ncbi:MAG: AAA-like domain protein [Parcubacteria group bacterium ADurb.Bin305]|nr:MAG: AAA-like domain protein [Parcubacteria group bacterium ADurb.Bin305]